MMREIAKTDYEMAKHLRERKVLTGSGETLVEINDSWTGRNFIFPQTVDIKELVQTIKRSRHDYAWGGLLKSTALDQ